MRRTEPLTLRDMTLLCAPTHVAEGETCGPSRNTAAEREEISPSSPRVHLQPRISRMPPPPRHSNDFSGETRRAPEHRASWARHDSLQGDHQSTSALLHLGGSSEAAPWPGPAHPHGRSSSVLAQKRRSGDPDVSAAMFSKTVRGAPSLSGGNLPQAADFLGSFVRAPPPPPPARPSALPHVSPPPAGARPSFAKGVTRGAGPAASTSFSARAPPATRQSILLAILGDQDAAHHESAGAIRSQLSRVYGGGAGGAPAMLRELSRGRGGDPSSSYSSGGGGGGFVLEGHADAVHLERRPLPAMKVWAQQARKAAGMGTGAAEQLLEAVRRAIAEIGPPSSRRKSFW